MLESALEEGSAAGRQFVLFERCAEWDGPARLIASWDGMSSKPGYVSIPAEVEGTALAIRSEYLSWVASIGQAKVGDQTLAEYLRFNGQLSGWWTGLISEKSPMKSPGIYEVFKLRALEQLYHRADCQGCVYVGGDERLSTILRGWCAALGHPYRWIQQRYHGGRDEKSRLAHVYAKLLPHSVQAILVLIRFYWRAISARLSSGKPINNAALIVTYFPNIDQKAARQGRFQSSLFGPLQDALKEASQPVNWIWLYAWSADCDYRSAIGYRNAFNRSRGGGSHFLLEEFLRAGDAAAVLLNALSNRFRWHDADKLGAKFHLPGSAINFFPILKEDWRSSLFGKVAMEGMIYSRLFDRMTAILPAAPWGLYVWENQGWEAALLTSWRRRREEQIIGYQHAILARLNLRNFSHPNDHQGTGVNCRPMPDALAVGGRVAQHLLEQSGFPSSRLVLTEALRYLGLKAKPKVELKPPAVLLVITGYLPEETRFQLRLLKQVSTEKGFGTVKRIIIKAHPFLPVGELMDELSISLPWESASGSLADALAQADFAFLANSTSAAIDACACSVPLAVCVAPNGMNLNPLFGEPAIPMVSNASDLSRALEMPQHPPDVTEYIETDGSLRRWRKLLTLPESGQLAS